LLAIQACLPTGRTRLNAWSSNNSDGRAEQEPPNGFATSGRLRDRLDKTATRCGDLLERAAEGRPRDALPAMLFVNVEAGDPPVRQRWRVLFVLLDAAGAVFTAYEDLISELRIPPNRSAELGQAPQCAQLVADRLSLDRPVLTSQRKTRGGSRVQGYYRMRSKEIKEPALLLPMTFGGRDER
jgi:hypothetical protein